MKQNRVGDDEEPESTAPDHKTAIDKAKLESSALSIGDESRSQVNNNTQWWSLITIGGGPGRKDRGSGKRHRRTGIWAGTAGLLFLVGVGVLTWSQLSENPIAAGPSKNSATMNSSSNPETSTTSAGKSKNEQAPADPLDQSSAANSSDGDFSSCTIKPEEMSLDDMRFADIGAAGFVSGQGDCQQLNIGTYGPAQRPWSEEQFIGCRLIPEEIGPQSDYRVFVKLVNQDEEFQINRDEQLDFPDGPDFIEYLRWELTRDMPKPENDYLGHCTSMRYLEEEYEGATSLFFNVDLTGITVDRPTRTPAS